MRIDYMPSAAVSGPAFAAVAVDSATVRIVYVASAGEYFFWANPLGNIHQVRIQIQQTMSLTSVVSAACLQSRLAFIQAGPVH